MTKRGIHIALSILSVFVLLGPLFAQNSFKKFSIKLSGGYGNTSGGDLDTVISGMNSLLVDLASELDFTVNSQLTNLNWGPEFEVEFVFNLTETIGFGLGSGYIRRGDESLGRMELPPVARVSFS